MGHESIQTTVQYIHLMIDNLKRIYKTYHIRENEYFKEIDSDYINRIEIFVNQLKKQNKINLKEYNRRRGF